MNNEKKSHYAAQAGEEIAEKSILEWNQISIGKFANDVCTRMSAPGPHSSLKQKYIFSLLFKHFCILELFLHRFR